MKSKIEQTHPLQQIDFLALGLKIKSTAQNSSEHIAFLEEEIAAQLTFVEEHIAALEQKALLNLFKEEFQQRATNRELSYEWWLIFVYRLSILLTPNNRHDLSAVGNPGVDLFIQQVIKENAWHNHNYFVRLANESKHSMIGLINRFPDVILIPATAGVVDILEFNKALVHNVLPLGLVSTPITADGEIFQPHRFYRHDLVHAYTWFFFRTYAEPGFKLFLDYALSILRNERDERQRSQLNFMLFFITHEIPSCLVLLSCSNVIDEFKSLMHRNNVNLLQLCLMNSWYAPLLSPYLPSERKKRTETSIYLEEAISLIGNYIEYFFHYFKMDNFSATPCISACYNPRGIQKTLIPESMADYRKFHFKNISEDSLINAIEESDKNYLDLSWNNMGEREDIDQFSYICYFIPHSVITLDLSKNKLHMISLPSLLSTQELPNINTVYLSHDEVHAMSAPQFDALKAIFPNIQEMLVIDDAGNVIENIAYSLAAQRVQTHSQHRFFQQPNKHIEFEASATSKLEMTNRAAPAAPRPSLNVPM